MFTPWRKAFSYDPAVNGLLLQAKIYVLLMRISSSVVKVRGEDRIFTTAMAVNTLVNTWSVFNYTQGQVSWFTGELFSTTQCHLKFTDR